MFIVNLTGGLGNQLFQYAFGKYLEKQNNIEVLYYNNTNIQGKYLTSRILLLQEVGYDVNLATKEEVQKRMLFTNYKIERRLLKNFPFFNRKIVVEKVPSHIQEGTFFDGYWQNIRYVSYVEEEMKKKFKLSREMLNKDIINNIRATNSVSIHIRRGDYLNKKNSKIFEQCTPEYYNRAVKFIKKKEKDLIFYVFSDDLQWAEEHLNLTNVVFVDNNLPEEDLYLMSRCRHNIIANSSFSWWGALLNKNDSKIVIAPSKWYKDEKNKITDNLIYPSWTRL